MTVEDWAKRIDKFLDVTDRPILLDEGHVSTEDPRLTPNQNLKSTALFKTAYFSQISTTLTITICHRLTLILTKNNSYINKKRQRSL